MIGNFLAVPPRTFEWLTAEPDWIAKFLYADDPEALPEPMPRGPAIDVGKAWHGLHFLLTGTAWGGSAPLAFIAAGGVELGDVDVGYGPARAFAPHEVQAIARALEPLSSDALRARFNPTAMAQLEIYPTIKWERDGADAFEYLADHFEGLKTFVLEAAAAGHALIVYLS